MSTKKNDKSLSVFYQILGAFSLIAGVGLAGIHALRGQHLDKLDAGIIIILVCVCLALLRPEWFDNLVKTILDKLPFFSYKKDV